MDGLHEAGGPALSDLQLQITYVDPRSIEPAGRKLRVHAPKQLAKLQRSIERHGFNVPLLVDEQDALLAGHARLEVAKRLGLSRVPTVRLAHMDAATKRSFVIAESRIGEEAKWDRDLLAEEFADLAALDPAFDFTFTGFETPEIDALQFSLGDEDADDQPRAKSAPARAEPISRRGDVWHLGAHRLMCGDATSASDIDHLLQGRAPRLVEVDFPYNVKIAGHVTGSGQHGEFVQASGEMSDAEFTAFLGDVHLQIERVLANGGLLYGFMDWRHVANMADALRRTQLELINLCVWSKDTPGQGAFYRSQHELVFVSRKGEQHLNRIELGKHGRNRSNVWSYPGVIGFGAERAATRALHPTVKPTALVKDLILDCTAKGDLVADFFSGSGTTILAAERTGRVACALDLDPKYVDVSIERFEARTGVRARHAETGLTLRETALARTAEPRPDLTKPTGRRQPAIERALRSFEGGTQHD